MVVGNGELTHQKVGNWGKEVKNFCPRETNNAL